MMYIVLYNIPVSVDIYNVQFILYYIYFIYAVYYIYLLIIVYVDMERAE